MRKLTYAQLTILALLEKHGKIKFVHFKLNSYMMMDKNNKLIPGKLYHATVDALKRRGLIKRDGNGYIIKEPKQVFETINS